MKILILYIPVVHEGYIKLLNKYNGKISKLYILGEDIISELTKVKEIRAIDAKIVSRLISGLGYSFKIKVLTKKELNKSLFDRNHIIVANDLLSDKFSKKYLSKVSLEREDVFLRWDEKKVESSVLPSFDRESVDKFDRKIMKIAVSDGNKSTDWWRRVGAVVVRNKNILVRAHNHYLPSENDPYINGNPRDFIKSGTLGFLATSVHAEQAAIAKACKLGLSLKGSNMYVSTYPCPTCAKLMAIAGIKKCFFMGGNAYLNVDQVFKSAGIKTVLIREL